jgi:putative ferrous iron transport protein C
MILTDIRDYLRTKHQASLRDMALEFSMDQEALRPILEQLVNKGKAEKLPQGSTCEGGCHSCAPETIEIYQWIK